MRVKTLGLLTVAGALTVFYFALLYLAVHPRVSREYKAYFIDRTTKEWHPVHNYRPNAEQESFGTPTLPAFIRSIYGFSVPEQWGRWTDANYGTPAKIVLRYALTGPVCLDVKARAAGSQDGKAITLALGTEQRRVVFDSHGFSHYYIDFFESQSADVLELRFSGPIPPENAGNPKAGDARRLGLAVAGIRFFSTSCASVSRWRD
jgi:hypothetical protein